MSDINDGKDLAWLLGPKGEDANQPHTGDIDDGKELAWFLGPKGENANLFEELLLQIVRDYSHWRRNYFPDDPILLSKRLRNHHVEQEERLDETLTNLLAQLRRNFPFYSPRYMGHELSDTLVSAQLGYIAGMLYNPNNVTPEAAPVTTELEIEVCSSILKMLGYKAPPGLPDEGKDVEAWYAQRSREQFGWAHLTSGGTVANIEALWVARQVRYSALSIKQVAEELSLEITVKSPRGEVRPISKVGYRDLLLIKPNEAIYLLGRYFEALRNSPARPQKGSLSAFGWKRLEKCALSISKGYGKLFADHPPVLIAAGSQHYSVTKAANILGIGSSNIEKVKTDEHFRMDVGDLEQVLRRCIKSGKVPLAVIVAAGTTEEGSVDPIHEIVDLRSRFEKSEGVSFWLHVDAAWGGFMRSLFSLEPRDEVCAVAMAISHKLSIAPPSDGEDGGGKDLLKWHLSFATAMRERALVVVDEESPAGESTPEKHPLVKTVESDLRWMLDLLRQDEYGSYARRLARLGELFKGRSSSDLGSFRLDLDARNRWIGKYVSTKVKVGNSTLTLNWPAPEVASAFLAFPCADSIAVDPHKMGYAPYPAGCIAFKNDRARSFILQHAPYITSSKRDELIHVPPRHVEVTGGKRRVVTESFSPYMLEGSRPGAVAAGLWAAMKTVPYVPHGHGHIVRASLLSARVLYEWLTRWDAWCRELKKSVPYRFVSLAPTRPDTNIVTFIVANAVEPGIVESNRLSSLVYETFSIQAELGEREYSYRQPFFLSQTRMMKKSYSVQDLKSLFERAKFNDRSRVEYGHEGLVVLRASVMNPYILASLSLTGQDFCRLFIEELDDAARRAVAHLSKEENRLSK